MLTAPLSSAVSAAPIETPGRTCPVSGDAHSAGNGSILGIRIVPPSVTAPRTISRSATIHRCQAGCTIGLLGAQAPPPGTEPRFHFAHAQNRKSEEVRTEDAIERHRRAYRATLAGSCQPAGLHRARGLQALRAAHHLSALPFALLRAPRAELERLIADPASEYYTRDRRVAAEILADARRIPARGSFHRPRKRALVSDPHAGPGR